MNLLEIKKLYKEYDNEVVVDQINLEIKEGEIFGLLGPNGAGKSTTIGMITGLIKKSAGEIQYEDKTNKISKWKHNIGLVPQEYALYMDLTAEENISFFASLYGLKGNMLKERVSKVLEFVGLSDCGRKKVDNFSGGMKRRLNIACAIAHNPKLIIMDEPTVGIDPQSRNHILETVKKLRNEGATIIYTSHYMQEVDELCDRIAIIDKGRVIAEGSSGELKALINDKRNFRITLQKEMPELIEELDGMTGIENIIVNENEYLISTLKSTNVIDKIVTLIIKNKGVILNIINEEPTLENVFLALTGKRLRE